MVRVVFFFILFFVGGAVSDGEEELTTQNAMACQTELMWTGLEI